jgi:hypothetical protein
MSEETQAVYILRRLLESEAAGVEHTFIYDFKDDGPDLYSHEQNFGLVHNDLSAKQAYLGLQRLTGFLAGMATVPPAKQASIENDPTVQPDRLGNRCHTFASSDEQTTVVAFWEVKAWDPSAPAANAVITLPLAHEPHHVFLYDLLSGSQTEITGKLSKDGGEAGTSSAKDSARAKADHQVSLPVSLSAAPELLIIR